MQPEEPQPNSQTNEALNPFTISRPVPPTLLRIYADNQDKRTICIFWVVFFSVIVVIAIASAFLPYGTYEISNRAQFRGSNLENCSNPTWFNSSKFLQCSMYENTPLSDNKVGSAMFNLQRMNQFALIFYDIKVVDISKSTPAFQSPVTVSLYDLNYVKGSDGLTYIQYEEVTDSQATLTINPKNSLNVYGEDKKTLIGYRVPVFVNRNFKEDSFLLVVQFQKNIKQYTNIDSINTSVLLVNPEFTKYSFAVRYIFFALSALGCILYIVRFLKIPAAERILEQKMIVVLSVLLVFFNDPFYPVTVLQPNRASSYFSVFFIINFTLFLIFTWIVFLDRVYYEDGQKQSQLINWKRIGYIFVTYVVTLVLYTLIAFDHIEGLPLVPTQDLISNKFIGLEVVTLILLMLGFGYIILSYIRLCSRANELMWRNQLFMFFSIFFIIVTVVLFFADGFEINSFAGNRILLLFTVMNMYTFYLQYMYSITREETQRTVRGQYENQGVGLLEVATGSDGDCVDLEFDDMPREKQITYARIDQFVNKRSDENKLQGKEPEQPYSPNYGADYVNDLRGAKDKTGQGEDRPDFLKEQQVQESEEQEQPYQGQRKDNANGKKKDAFQEFSLGD